MLIEDINTTFEKVFAGLPIEMQINGFATVFAKLNAFVVESQLISFVIALIAIGLFLVTYLKNFRRALIVLIPNVIPVFAVLALMALFDIPLGVTTAMIAPIILGIGMDDTIHLLYHFRKQHFKGKTVSEALTQSIGYTAPALIVSSVSLSAGFLIIAFSYTPAVADFGLLCLLAVIIALITDLLLLPALIRRFW
jgi:predicted RND superfamily exporter protein